MSFALGVVIFVVAVLVSVILHELGHFLTAKKFGMKVTQFFIGFGQTVWSTRRGETEYGIKSLPFGAYVRITGMTTFDEVAPEDEPRAMRNKPRWQRAIVMVAGSFMHFALAFVLLIALALVIGQANATTPPRSARSAPACPTSAEGPGPRVVPAQPGRVPGARSPGSGPTTRLSRSRASPCTPGPSSHSVIAALPRGSNAVSVTVQRGGKQLTLKRHPGHRSRAGAAPTSVSMMPWSSGDTARWAP